MRGGRAVDDEMKRPPGRKCDRERDRGADSAARAWCDLALRGRGASRPGPTARSPRSGARATGRRAGASMRSRSRGPRISSARPADQTAQVSTRPSRRRRARVSRRLAPRGLVRTLASFRRDISSCTSGAPSNSRGNCAPAAVDDASGSASSLRPKPCRPAPTPGDAVGASLHRSVRE